MTARANLLLALQVLSAYPEADVYCEPILVVQGDIDATDTVRDGLGQVTVVTRMRQAPDPEIDGAPGYHKCPGCPTFVPDSHDGHGRRRASDGRVFCAECSDDIMDAEQDADAEYDDYRVGQHYPEPR